MGPDQFLAEGGLRHGAADSTEAAGAAAGVAWLPLAGVRGAGFVTGSQIGSTVPRFSLAPLHPQGLYFERDSGS